MMTASEKARKIKEGFKINWMNMTNFESGEIIWKSETGQNFHDSESEIKARIPKKILQCKAVARELNFSSIEPIQRLRLEQSILLSDEETEFFQFKFGFVMPDSTNNWQQIIETASEEQMIPAELLSGNLVVHTKFFDGDMFLCESKVRIYYV
jgi:retinal rod rhodopsin-sensitive cGMP 3',5'-cyclic phosphodiesterase subunit delta